MTKSRKIDPSPPLSVQTADTP